MACFDVYLRYIALLVLLGVSVSEGVVMLRFMLSELLVPSALALIGASILEVVTIIVITSSGRPSGRLSTSQSNLSDITVI